ncbi:ABC transporter substrate-binding protein [Brachybacterium sp. GCM10030252]
MTRRRALGTMGATGLASLAALSACGGDPGAATEGAGGDAVEFVFLGNVNQREQFDQLFAAFTEKHPEIDLQTAAKSGSWAQFTYTVATQIAGGQPPDIIQMATEGQRLFASKGVLAPLDDLIAGDQDIVEDYYDDIHDNLRIWSTQYGSPDGSTYYMPGGYNPVVQFCNMDLLTGAGVDLPEDGFTWSDLMDAGKKVKSQGAFLMTAGNGYWHDVLPWLTNNGTSSLDEDWARATINSREAIEAAEFARELVAKGYAPEPGGSYDAPTLMQRGELATFTTAPTASSMPTASR